MAKKPCAQKTVATGCATRAGRFDALDTGVDLTGPLLTLVDGTVIDFDAVPLLNFDGFGLLTNNGSPAATITITLPQELSLIHI